MNNDPNNMNNGPVESLEPVETLETPVVPEQPVTPQPVPVPEPVVLEQLQEPQRGTNPHQHVDMNSLTPRTVFETSVKNPEPKKEEAPKVEDKANAPKEKSTIGPLILFLLVLAAGGYFLYTQFSPKPDESIYEQPQEQKEEVKEEKEEKEETKKEETPKEETKEESGNKEATTDNSNNNPQPAGEPSQPAEETPAASGDIEMISGMIIYLYEGGGIGVDEFYAEYISHTDTDIKVKITIKETNSKEYTIKYGEKTSIDGLKNQIVITKASENFPIEFK